MSLLSLAARMPHLPRLAMLKEKPAVAVAEWPERLKVALQAAIPSQGFVRGPATGAKRLQRQPAAQSASRLERSQTKRSEMRAGEHGSICTRWLGARRASVTFPGNCGSSGGRPR